MVLVRALVLVFLTPFLVLGLDFGTWCVSDLGLGLGFGLGLECWPLGLSVGSDLGLGTWDLDLGLR